MLAALDKTMHLVHYYCLVSKINECTDLALSSSHALFWEQQN